MSNAAIAMDGRAAVTPTELSWKFIRWGFGLFITGFLTGFIEAGKNVWLAAQGLSIAVYVVGICFSFARIRRSSAQLR